ncbi:MAG: SDR family NAD(P)-dependent oxidoreductase [Gemmatimonadaceae bacterium]
MIRFTDKHALVTGASRGLGRAVAVAFAREGARVGIGYRSRESEARETLAAVVEVGGTGVLLQFDVRDYAGVDSAVTSFALSGGLDVLVNCAAALRDEFMALLAPAEWEEVVAVNLTGTFHCCRAVVRHMLLKRSGAIVNVASVSGVRASPGQVSYSASKAGVVSLTATAGVELAARGIRVNAVVPGLLTSGMGRRLNRDVAEQRRASIPLARFGDADEVARAVLFLASDDASYIVGQSLVVDGGLSL